MNKKTLRKTYLEKRKTLSEKEYRLRNNLLLQRVLDFPAVRSSQSIHLFLSIASQNEPDTLRLLDPLRKMQKKLFVPRIHGNHLEHFELEESTVLNFNSFGVPEPQNGEPVDPEILDIILIPMVICDKEGNRIGYGKGYYDIFLAQYPDTLKVGLSLGPPLDLIPFYEPHDIRLDYCISPYRTYEFGSNPNKTSN